jgi:hypothetical protein
LNKKILIIDIKERYNSIISDKINEDQKSNNYFGQLLFNELIKDNTVEIIDPVQEYVKFGFKKFNKILEETIKKFDIIIFFQIWFFGFKHNLFSDLKKKNKIKLISFDIESNEMIFIYYLKLLENFDLVFATDSILASEIYKKKNINAEFYPISFSSKHYYPSNYEKIYDGSFMGQKHSDRESYINFLINKNFNIKTFGSYKNERIPNEKFNKIIHQTKINLYFSKQKKKSSRIFDLTMSYNMKYTLLHFAMLQAFFLIEYSDEHNFFLKKYNFLMFKNKNQLLDKFSYFLKNEKERVEISKKIWADIGEKFSFEERYKNLQSKIFNIPTQNKVNDLDINKQFFIKDLFKFPINFENSYFIINNVRLILLIKSFKIKVFSIIDFMIYLFRTFKIKTIKHLLHAFYIKNLETYKNKKI